MNIRPEEISNVIKEQIRNYTSKIEMKETGTVILVGDGIARVYGLRECMASELQTCLGLLPLFCPALLVERPKLGEIQPHHRQDRTQLDDNGEHLHKFRSQNPVVLRLPYFVH